MVPWENMSDPPGKIPLGHGDESRCLWVKVGAKIGYVYFCEAIVKVPAFVPTAYQYSTSFSGMLVGHVYSTEY